MKYHLYDDKEKHQGTFESVEKLRNFLCDRKYNTNCDFDYLAPLIILNLSSGILKLRNKKWHLSTQ